VLAAEVDPTVPKDQVKVIAKTETQEEVEVLATMLLVAKRLKFMLGESPDT
jgi:hypothetical protein